MEQFFVDFFQSYPDAFKYWGLLIVLAVTFLESLPILGALLPGQILVIFAGFLAQIGVFGFWGAFGAAALGAVLGDIAGFLLGRKYGGWLMQKKIWKLERKHFEATARLVEANSIKSIFIGRLHSFTRTLMPFAAGMSRMGVRKFIITDIATAVVWALLSIFVGFIFGKSFNLVTSFAGQFILWATIAAVVLSVAIYQMRKRGKKISWLDASLAGVSFGALYLFSVVAGSFGSGRLFRILDARVESFVLSHPAPSLQNIMTFFTHLGDPATIALLASVFILLLISKKRWRDTVFVATTLGLGAVLVDVLKSLFERARPFPNFIEASGPSFPSGHAVMAAIAVIALYFVSLRKIKREGLRNAVVALFSLVAVAIGLSRVYLNVHWATDVLAGFLAGIFFASFAILAWRVVAFVINKSRKTESLPDAVI